MIGQEDSYRLKKWQEEQYREMKEKSEKILKLVRDGSLKTPALDVSSLFQDTNYGSNLFRSWNRKLKNNEEEKENVNV